MNRNRTRQIVICLLIAGGVLLVAGSDANADYVFGTPTNLGSTVNSSVEEWGPSFSADGLSLYFSSRRPAGGDSNIWVTTRATTEHDWGAPVSLGPTVNSSADDAEPTISADGLSLFFMSTRTDGYGDRDIWLTTRPTISDAWGPPINLGPKVNGPHPDGCPNISADGLSLFFISLRPGGSGGADIWVTRRATTDDDWGAPVNLGPKVNGSAWDLWPCISADGLRLFFGSDRPGGQGDADIWLTSRATTDDDWGTPTNLGLSVNTSAWDVTPNLPADGSTLYFVSNRAGGHGNFDLWQVSISPDVDLNSDGKVDLKDMGLLLMVGWGTDNSVYDIGPTPFGDGIVDSKDLMVLAEYGAILAGDANYDGVVDFLDLAEVAKNWLRQQP
jgi:Tol biopolymer transport system component